MFARHFIDSLDFARKGGESSGEVVLADLPRLQDLLASPDGTIRYVVRGMIGRDGRPMLELTLEGSCQLRCQRCMEAMLHPVKLSTGLLLVPDGEFEEFSGEEDEPDSIVADTHLDVSQLVEDELLLSLPFAPKHAEGVCRFEEAKQDDPDPHPFAVLSGLKVK